MKRFKKFKIVFSELIKLDLKRSLSWRHLVVCICFLAAALYQVQLGCDEYRLVEADKTNFQQSEALRFSLHKNYDQYGTTGIRFFFMPSPASVFFGTPAVFKRIQASINDKEKLDVHTSLLNGSPFDDLSADFMTYSGFLFYGGSLLFLLFGYESSLDRDYIKFLSAIAGGVGRVYYAIFLTRFILILIFLAVVSTSALLVAALNGIHLPWFPERWGFLVFSYTMALFYFFFLLLGKIAGALQSKHWRIGTLAACWLILLFAIPGVVNKYAARDAQRTSPVYELEMKNLQFRALITDDWPVKGPDKDKNIFTQLKETMQKLLFRNKENTGWEVDNSEIVRYERGVIRDFVSSIFKYQDLSAVFPTTFYLSLSHEVGSRGFINLFKFYIQAYNRKAKFMKYKWEKLIAAGIHDPTKASQIEIDIEPFTKGDENVFYARSVLTSGYNLGQTLLWLYVGILSAICFIRFKILIFGSYFGCFPGTRHLAITVAPGEKRMFKTPIPFIQQFFNRVSGEFNQYKGKLSLAGKEIEERDPRPFIYLGSPDCLPGGMKVRFFMAFIQKVAELPKKEKEQMQKQLKQFRGKRLKKLSVDEKAEVTLKLVKFTGFKLYMLVDFVNRMTPDGVRRFDEQLETPLEQGASVLYFNTYPTYDPPMTFKGCTLVNEVEGRCEIENLK
jgi:hypothetical protein